MLQVFQLFRTYVASVSSKYCKSRSGVTHVALRPIYHSPMLQLLACLHARGFGGARAAGAGNGACIDRGAAPCGRA
jgi:hypothetical protein